MSTRLSSSSSSTGSSVRICSYNVLSSHLSEPTYYTYCRPEWLSPEHRLSVLKTKLDGEVAQGSIICLQEVSNPWAGHLHAYFSRRGYSLITGLYGKKFNGYMGVAIAVPLNLFDVESVDITRVADTKKVIRQPKPSVLASLVRNWLINPFLTLLRAVKILGKAPEDPWDLSLSRMNQMVSVRVSPRIPTDVAKQEGKEEEDSSFVVSTYHMPCVFAVPQVMMIHCALAAQHVQNLAAGRPYILAGDFNIKPQDSTYELLTKGEIDAKNPDYPPAVEGDNWQLKVAPLRSAYKEVLGKEPAFTNWAQNCYGPAFKDTLDYVFLSKQWRTKAVLRHSGVDGQSEIVGPLPIENEPSDHLLIAADLEIGK